MEQIKTDWFPGDVAPVNPGIYDVVVMTDLVTEEETTASWDKHLGQWGFWKAKSWAEHYKLELIKVLRWRGRLLPHRTKLVQEPEVRVMRRTLLKVES